MPSLVYIFSSTPFTISVIFYYIQYLHHFSRSSNRPWIKAQHGEPTAASLRFTVLSLVAEAMVIKRPSIPLSLVL